MPRLSNLICTFFCAYIISSICGSTTKDKTISDLKYDGRHSVHQFLTRHRKQTKRSWNTNDVDVLQPSILIVPVSANRRERAAAYDDFNPFADVDETISNAYTDIEHNKAIEVAIDAARAEKAVQEKQISSLEGLGNGLKQKLEETESLGQIAKQEADMARRQEQALEYRLIKERMLNKAQARQLSEETARRVAAEAENQKNMRKLIELENNIRQLRLNNGDDRFDCRVSHCINGGVCISRETGGVECLCPNDFSGLTCQIPVLGYRGMQFSVGSTITLREVGSEVVIMMPVGLMIALAVLQITSFLTCVIQCCIWRR